MYVCNMFEYLQYLAFAIQFYFAIKNKEIETQKLKFFGFCLFIIVCLFLKDLINIQKQWKKKKSAIKKRLQNKIKRKKKRRKQKENCGNKKNILNFSHSRILAPFLLFSYKNKNTYIEKNCINILIKSYNNKEKAQK